MSNLLTHNGISKVPTRVRSEALLLVHLCGINNQSTEVNNAYYRSMQALIRVSGLKHDTANLNAFFEFERQSGLRYRKVVVANS